MTHEEYEQEVMEMALSLTKGMPPEFNIAPYIDLCRKAMSMGCKVVRRDDNQEPRGPGDTGR